MTRVVHVVVAGEIGGAERMLVDLASRPDSTYADHSVALITPNRALAHLLRDAGLRVHDRGPSPEGPLRFLSTSFGPGDVAWIARVISQERADVAHLHTFASQVVGTRAALRAGARVVRTEHSTRVFDDPICWPFARWSLARADTCVAISEHVLTVAAARAPWAAGKLRVVRNGVDVHRFAPRASPRANDFTFAVVGRLEPRKGVDLAIDALAQVPNARIEVVGDGAARASLERRALRRGVGERVVFHGFLPDTRDRLARSDAALCSSRSEGLGIALLEAMAMARPVVGFAVGGVPEIVDHGVTGLLAPAGDVDALAMRMRQAMSSRERMRALGEAARAEVVARFSVNAMCAGYAAAYAERGVDRHER
jgi:glycosyltransferase involved in cell wall biosynthesis